MAEEVFSFIKNSIYAEEMAERTGLLQRLDPRAKLLSFILVLASVLLARRLEVLLALNVLVLLLSAASKISPALFLKRVWLFIPLFAGIVAFPIIFSPASPGEPWIVLFRWGDGKAFAITYDGLWMAAVLVLRVATCVSLSVLLVLTTRWAHLLGALRVFGVPRIFVLTMQMTYRYIFLLMGILEAENLAKESRTIRQASLRAERRWTASRIGLLFQRSRQMGEEVYLAMLSRGYAGGAGGSLEPSRWKMGDLAGTASCLVLLGIVVFLNRGT